MEKIKAEFDNVFHSKASKNLFYSVSIILIQKLFQSPKVLKDVAEQLLNLDVLIEPTKNFR